MQKGWESKYFFSRPHWKEISHNAKKVKKAETAQVLATKKWRKINLALKLQADRVCNTIPQQNKCMGKPKSKTKNGKHNPGFINMIPHEVKWYRGKGF